MILMTKLNNEINAIKKKLQKVDAENMSMRIKQIDKNLISGKIGLDNLTSDELIYIHSRLHFFYHIKNFSLKKEKIEEIHAKISEKLQNHAIFDHLDTKK